jgi:2,3-bisphosphoglycerate-dependent phosphoglycerate mutase
MVKLLWARHGENVANLTGTLSYRVFDGDLTERGKRQARELAGRLAAAGRADPVRLLACSPLRRARQTAQIVGSQLGLPDALEVDDLRELNVGLLDGRSDTYAWHTYYQVLAAWRAGHTHVRFPSGEDRNELCTRLRRALLAIADRSAGTTSLVVAHGGSLRAALPCLAVEADPGTDLPLGAVATMRIDPSHPHSGITLLSWPATSPPGAPA